METERIYNLTEQEYLIQGTCVMQSDNSSSQRSAFDPESEDLFYKYSPSKAVMVEEQVCLKRKSLAFDRDSIIPFKKRKQLHKESDSSSISTDQNLQMGNSNEGISGTSCPKFEKESFHESTPSSSQKAYEKGQIEFNLQSSIFVKAEDSAEWIRLKCFDSITLNESNSATFFTGGPIQSSAFFISPHDVKVNQYVAVAVGNAFYKNHSYANTKNTSGIIQLWNLGSLHERKLLDQLPSMELALYHDNGIITEMKWSPANCFDKYPSTCHLPRMGMLAAASSNSCVYVYNLPQLDFMPKLKPAFPIYFTEPDLKLTPLFGKPSNVTMKAITTCVEWGKSGERIVAGYGNGSVCVWMIKVPSYTSRIGVKRLDQSYIIHPYLFFQAAGAPITSLSFAPFSNNRWLSVLSEDGHVKFFDLLNTSIPFMSLKQGFGSHCIWGESFCGVYTAPILNSLGHISLSVTDIYAESLKKPCNEKEKVSRIIQKIGVFDSSTNLAASGNGNFHAIADMTGSVLVNFLANQSKPLETYYLAYMLFETQIMTLDILDLEMKTSQSKMHISGNIFEKEISSMGDTKGPFFSKVKQESLSSSSSSGFCSPKNSKTFVIDLAQCFEDDAGNLQQINPGSSNINSFKDKNNNGINAFLNKPLNSGEETSDKMIKGLEFSGDLMRDLLMAKVSNQSKSVSPIFPFNNSNNSACCDSKDAKHLSTGPIVLSSAASDYTGDTIIYPKEDYYCDTSHQKAFSSVESNVQSISLVSNEKINTLHDTMVHKMNRKTSFQLECFAENSVDFACPEIITVNSGSNANLSSKNCSESNTENCHLNYKNENLRKMDCFGSDNPVSFICNNPSLSNNYPLNLKYSDVHLEDYHDSKKYQIKIMKNEGLIGRMNSKDNLISSKDTVNLSLNKKLDDPLNDVPRPNNQNLPNSLPNMYLSTTSNDFIICDRDQKVSFGAFNHSSTVSDYSDETIIYHDESNTHNDVKYLNTTNPGAISKSLCNIKQENTFQDISLHKMEQEAALHGTKTKLLTENCHSLTAVKCENFLGSDSIKCNSEYETDSAAESCIFSDDNRNFKQKNISISNFHLLQSEHLCYVSEEKQNFLNGLPQCKKNPQKLSYENLVSSFGVVFKNGLSKSTKPLTSQKDGIYVKYNPLSVIKTICWNPNKGCESWLFVGGNSGIGRLVFVPDYLAVTKNKPRRRKRH